MNKNPESKDSLVNHPIKILKLSVIAMIALLIIGFIMFCMGLTLTKDDFKILAKRPVDLLIGAAAQYLIMPFSASV